MSVSQAWTAVQWVLVAAAAFFVCWLAWGAMAGLVAGMPA